MKEWVCETECTALESAELPPGAGRIGLVGEVSENRHRDNGDTPQRSYNEPHEILHHRLGTPGRVRIRARRILLAARNGAESPKH